MNTTQETRSPKPSSLDEHNMQPPVDVVEDADGITLFADMPGVPREKLSVRVEADTLIIEGELSLPVVPELQPGHVEVVVPRYYRAFTLGPGVDGDRIAAELKNGVLTLRIPKAERARPRKIEVRVQ
ncbi:Hsp20/alpha crystallin family protein [Uliginosibacterium gangwonense]|uniref:Hsp20/alpha crystallin family protein n=1 Tax=Uliginosibacterium gangwonense TaxID=392736 RepID=UPI0003799543|nr:Hsp20/alpha crystallin family protein [Uliginosibacterium gangwonense]